MNILYIILAIILICYAIKEGVGCLLKIIALIVIIKLLLWLGSYLTQISF